MNVEKDILEIIREELSNTDTHTSLHNRIQNRLVSYGTSKNFTSIKEYLHANPFQTRRGRVDVFWESKRINYAIEIDLSLRKKSLQKLISLQAIAQPIWILLAPQPIEQQMSFLKENDCFGFVHILGPELFNERKPSLIVEDEDDSPDIVVIENSSIKEVISKATSWNDLENNLKNLGYLIKPKGGGLVFELNGMSMKASSFGKSFGFNALCSKLGHPPDHLHPNGYTKALGRPKKFSSNSV